MGYRQVTGGLRGWNGGSSEPLSARSDFSGGFMARNPLEFDPAREQRVREVAYHLWESNDKPHGRDLEFWERARELVGMEESAGAGLLPNPQTHPESARETGVEEAEIQENLGEFPGALTDQGEEQMMPTARKRRPRRKAG
jgi:Protein of unknown function (DUF2934)